MTKDSNVDKLHQNPAILHFTELQVVFNLIRDMQFLDVSLLGMNEELHKQMYK